MGCWPSIVRVDSLYPEMRKEVTQLSTKLSGNVCRHRAEIGDFIVHYSTEKFMSELRSHVTLDYPYEVMNSLCVLPDTRRQADNVCVIKWKRNAFKNISCVILT